MSLTIPPTMTEKSAAELRKPFPDKAVGKLPKGTCKACSQSQSKRCDRHTWVSGCPECKGSHSSATVHLDFVGHAATTDRLLAVDPFWSWEPMALDEAGLPALDRGGNLWIKLTVCGVTRLGVGDGRSAKECIGDAIRNGAMRFGVALDLWSKDELEQVTTGSARLIAALHSEPEPVRSSLGDALAPQTSGPDAPDEALSGAPVETATSGPESAPITKKTRGHLFALFAQKGVPEEQQLPGANHILGTNYTSRSQITEDDAQRIIAVLVTRPDVETPLPEAGAES